MDARAVPTWLHAQIEYLRNNAPLPLKVRFRHLFSPPLLLSTLHLLAAGSAILRRGVKSPDATLFFLAEIAHVPS
jgi:hypothetical protein